MQVVLFLFLFYFVLVSDSGFDRSEDLRDTILYTLVARFRYGPYVKYSVSQHVRLIWSLSDLRGRAIALSVSKGYL